MSNGRSGVPGGGSRRTASNRRAAPRGAQRKAAQKGSAASARSRGTRAVPDRAESSPAPALRLGFARGVAPSKWAERWARAVRDQTLELVPLDLAFGSDSASDVDVLLERAAPGAAPAGSTGPLPARHALRLYEETVALVLPAGHELAGRSRIERDELELVTLLDHADHAGGEFGWPDPERWNDPAWLPRHPRAALELVGSGIGAILLPQPLARHLASKRDHAVVPVSERAELVGSGIWASWEVSRDAADVQHLVGIMRGRTQRSSR